MEFTKESIFPPDAKDFKEVIILRHEVNYYCG